jgi:hypothetical protein
MQGGIPVSGEKGFVESSFLALSSIYIIPEILQSLGQTHII